MTSPETCDNIGHRHYVILLMFKQSGDYTGIMYIISEHHIRTSYQNIISEHHIKVLSEHHIRTSYQNIKSEHRIRTSNQDIIEEQILMVWHQ